MVSRATQAPPIPAGNRAAPRPGAPGAERWRQHPGGTAAGALPRTLALSAASAAGRGASAGDAPVPARGKLRVGADDDPLEQEADRLGSSVLHAPAAAGTAPAGPAANGPAPRGGGAHAPPVVHQVLHAPGQPLEEPVRAEFEGRFGQSFAGIRIHADRRAAESADALQARAYTVAQHIAFGAGQYAPETREGKRLLAHELAHTVQQTAARPHDPVVQRRRLPAGAGLGGVLPAGGAAFSAHRKGLVRALRRAWGALTAAQQTTVRTNAAGFGITGATDAALFTALAGATSAQLTSFASEIRTAAPGLELGDPALIDTGPRPGTPDAANITTLVSNTDAIFNTIATGARDPDLTQVFGAPHVATAKTKYANARTRMNALRASNHIVTDRSGYNTEVGLGGLTNSAQLSIESSAIDNPALATSIVMMLHESMHAGNVDVEDFGYIDQPSFTALDAAVKLNNAAHYEVVARRILGLAPTFAGVTFVPAGTSVGGVAAPPLTPTEQAIRNASETFRFAWTVGLNLHSAWVRVFRNPSDWTTVDLPVHYNGAQAGSRFSTVLPFWSRVEALTVHDRAASINSAAPTPPTAPVTLIDVALSEGLVRKLSTGMNGVPQTPADAATFELAHATPAERTAAAAGAAAEAKLLKRLVIRVLTGEMTGSVSRDERVLERMAATGRGVDFTEYFKIRGPGAFPF